MLHLHLLRSNMKKLNRKKAPAIEDAVDFKLSLDTPQQYRLSNATPVYALYGGTQEVVKIEWVFDAGNWYEDKNLVAASANFLLKNGTNDKTALQLSEEIEYYGAALSRQCYNETATITLHCLSKHVAALLPLISSLLYDATFPEEEINIYRQMQVQRLSVNMRKCDFIANRLIDEYLYGPAHPYGITSNVEAYNALMRAELQTFYQTYYTHGHCKIFAAGYLPANLDNLLEQYFGKLPMNSAVLPVRVHPLQPEKTHRHRVMNDENGVQGAIRIGRLFPNRKHPDYVKALVLNNIFGGYFGSRLMSNIREDKGYTYGIHSYLQPYQQQSAWIVSTEAGRDVCDATISEIYSEMKLLCDSPPDEEEMYLVRNYMMGSLLGDLDGPFQQITRWKNYVLNDLPEGYFENSIQTVKKITATELQALAQQYLQQADFYELLVI